MTKLEYKELNENGYSQKLINQIEKFNAQTGINIDTIIKYIDSDINFENLRELNNLLNKYTKLSLDTILMSLKIINFGININLYLNDAVYSNKSKRILINDIFRHWLYSTIVLDYEKLINNILLCHAEFADTTTIVDALKHKVDITDCICENFNDLQIKYALFLKQNGFDNYIKDVDKINGLDKSSLCWSVSILKIIKTINFNFVNSFNDYTNEQLQEILSLTLTGYDIKKFIANRKIKNIKACKILIDLGFDDDKINKLLDLTIFDLEHKSSETIEYYYSLLMDGYDINNAISIINLDNEKLPSKPVLYLVKLLLDLNYKGTNLKEIFDFLYSYSYKRIGFEDLKKEDIKEYIDLYLAGYNIKNLTQCNASKKDIDFIFSFADFYKFNKQIIIERYIPEKIRLINICNILNMKKLIPVILISKIDKDLADDIEFILDICFENNYYFDLYKLFFDNRNDHCDILNLKYEFNLEQKHILFSHFVHNNLDIRKIDDIRNNNFDDAVLNELLLIIKEGFSVSEILKKIDTLNYKKLEIIRTCMSFGFDVKAK